MGCGKGLVWPQREGSWWRGKGWPVMNLLSVRSMAGIGCVGGPLRKAFCHMW